ncbi:MAG: DUF6350 family protein, partial [Candidatus Phosphoribacter sp.]
MSLLYRVRDTVRTTRDALTADRGKLDAPGSSDLRTVWASGALAAGVSWLAVLVLGVMAWALSPASDVGWQQVIGVSSAAWLLGHGAAVHVESVSFSIVPLGVWLGAAAAAAYLLSHVLVRHDDALRRLLPRFLGGYAAVLAAAAAISLSGPARPTLAGLLCALSAPVVGQLVAVHRETGAIADRLPTWAVRAWRPAGWGLGLL